MEDDELCLNMLMNDSRRKFLEKSSNQVPQMNEILRKIFSRIERNILSKKCIASNFEGFCEYFEHTVVTAVHEFEKLSNRKKD